MRQYHKILKAIDIYSYRRFLEQMFIIVGLLLFSLVSGSAFAIENNPGSSLTCPANSTKGFLSNGSYSNLISSFTNRTYQNVVSQTTSTGSTNANIPLKIKMSVTSSDEGATNSTPALYGSSPQAISFIGNPSTRTPSTAITLEFQNSSNNQTVFLDQVAMSAFDIDKSVNSGSWDDNVKITGIPQSGAPITGTFQNIPNSKVIGSSSGLRLPSAPDDDNCTGSLQSDCQGSVVFDEPVKSVTLVYTDLKSNRTITSRRFEFRLDSYCYVPSDYKITKSDGVNSVNTNSITDYIIKVTNLGNTTISNITLKDPVANGLNKLTGTNDITCDASDTNNVCTTAPTKDQLESTSGFNIASLAVGQSFSIKVPTRVTATSNSNITNTATISHQTIATKSASDTNSVTFSNSLGGTPVPATCPADHKMYYLGANRTATPLVRTQTLGWNTNGSTSQTFNFNNSEPSGTKTFKIEFPSLLDINSTGGNTPPFYQPSNAVSVAAINLQHNSVGVKTNHTLDISVNRPVSKIGYKIQDIDSTSTIITNVNQVPYVEEIDVSTSRGQLTFNDIFHTINANRDVVSAIKGLNCSVNSGVNNCTIDATWDYTPANTPLRLEHKNIFNQYDSYHAVGYSDFYFCLAPPKVVVKKVLTGNRVNDADQFNIEVSGGTLSPNTANSPASFTTTGNGNDIGNAIGSVLTLQPATQYTITERLSPETNEGNINNYKASYKCTNATTNSTTVMPKGDGASFTLSNLDYGDEITCTITNTPSVYTFTGFVFNDNGGISSSTSTRQNISTTFTGNANYFNGIFDSSDNNIESGIGASGLQVRLTNCGSNGGTNIVGTTAQNIPESPPSGLLLGQYRFTVPASTIAALSSQKVCVVQVEPSNWEYSIDTTPNTREINLTNGLLDYKTESNGSRNLDFGEVKANNASLVLIKSQYVHTCSDSINFNSIPANPSPDSPTNGFSIQPVSDIDPGKCIAYRIEAYNRGHVDLQDIQITDKLQTEPVLSVFNLSRPLGVPDTVYNSSSPSPVYGQNGTIVSNKFNLVKPTTTSPTKATLFFNTKYGTTNNTNP
ncbi:hypothetical protein ACS8FD_00370 [Psychrobacter sp. 1U2]|uniref:hypothetical protein n=1 Tax=Psychrobacter sp. 1U2 TaxID=3453577 RepID=UPI003F48447B